MENDDLEQFDQEIKDLVDQLKSSFDSEKARWFHHEPSDTLYIELSGIEKLDDEYVYRIASPLFDELELEFEEIIILPYSL